MTREEELKKEGWEKRFTIDEPRLSEMVEEYQELGFQVLLDPVDISSEECTTCLKNPAFHQRYKTIYTRKKERSVDFLKYHNRISEERMHRIAVIPGDGIGKEVVPEGIRVVDAVSKRFDLKIEWQIFPWSCEYYKFNGQMMPSDGLDILSGFDAIFLGAIGDPSVPDHVSLWGLLIPIRRTFNQYVNLRPVKLLRGMTSPLRAIGPGDLDFCIVRENVEGEYSNVGGKFYSGTDQEMAVQESIFTRKGVERVMRFAFELAKKRPKKHVTSATKSNGIIYTMPYWDEIFREMSGKYPEIKTDQYFIDNLTALFVLHPEKFDVVVGSNLFGDILSDLGPAIAGSLGIAPSANLNPEKNFPSMFEPVHGSAPDISGRGIANPIGQIWSGAMMLEHLGHPDAARVVEEAIEVAIGQNIKTFDLGGRATTNDVGKAVAEIVKTI